MRDSAVESAEEAFEARLDDGAIAIVGMAGRFPGAADLEAFWHLLRDGREGITFFDHETLRGMGVPEAHLLHPDFVPAAPVLDDIDRFDAAFFGYSPREAQMLDPQHRLFLETAHAALESAGYDSHRFPGPIGIFGGTSMSTYMLFNILTNPRYAGPADEFPAMIANDKDFLTTRVAYHMDLRGPGVDVQTGCSTSLVAAHLACDALQAFQCDIALAGGVSVHVPQRTGYFHEPGGIASPDGHCRPFDGDGAGTLFGSGVGVVVLKRLEDALADGDSITAVVKASAINNDGSRKVGFTAPGMDGQTEVIARALSLAEVSPETIDFIEAHGTGTELGDPIEVGALTSAFRAATTARGFCSIGSVKSNIGHLDAAAGVAGLIKTCLALRQGEIPPSLHFREANPKLDLDASPFYVNDRLQPWPRRDRPRRAGVSSFGIGGTNAHLILEEAPPSMAGDEPRRDVVALVLSARSADALDRAERDLERHLETHPELALADVAHTLQVGRKRHAVRSVVVADSRDAALSALADGSRQAGHRVVEDAVGRRCVFLFPGGGVQHLGMGSALYEREPVFRDAVDECAVLLRPHWEEDLVTFLYGDGDDDDRARRIQGTVMALPALFTVEYACARLLMSWGLQPAAVVGHSMGEYVAACLAGVFSLEDSLAVVVRRAQLFDELPKGGMSSVPLSADQVEPLLGDRLAFAAINGPDECVVSGPVADLEAFDSELQRRGIETRRLKIDVAAHSPMIDLILPRFRHFLETLQLHPPTIPLIANVTGDWMTGEQACDPDYWVRHLRLAVRFGQGVLTLLEEPDFVFVEVGPGRALTTLAKQQVARDQVHRFVSSMRHPMDTVADGAHVALALGKLWMAGVDVDWRAYYAEERRLRVPLPTYPFERERYWIDPGEGRASAVARKGKSVDLDTWPHVLGWLRHPLPAPAACPDLEGTWLLFDDGDFGPGLASALRARGVDLVKVTAGPSFVAAGDYTIRPGIRADYDTLIRELVAAERAPRRVLHCWGMIEGDEGFTAITDLGYHSVLFLQQALDAHGLTTPLTIDVLARGLYAVESGDQVLPDLAPLLGPCLVLPQEHHHLTIRILDLDRPDSVSQARRIDDLMAHWDSNVDLPLCAWRGRHCWIPRFDRLSLAKPDMASVFTGEGCYLITGGLGGIGLLLARHVAGSCDARLVLTSRSGLPPRTTWDTIVAIGDPAVAARVRAVRALEARGAQVEVLAADVTDRLAMEAVVEAAETRFGSVQGAVHAAGLAGARTIASALELDREGSAEIFAAKVDGCRVLYEVLRGRGLDFVLLMSSNVTWLGGLGATAYAAANCFLDAFAATWPEETTRWISCNWDGWLLAEKSATDVPRTSIDHLAMTPSESTAMVSRIVAGARVDRVLVSTCDVASRHEQWIRHRGVPEETSAAGDTAVASRRLETPSVPPENELQALIVKVWGEQLGMDDLGIHDNFFDLGGSSLIALKLAGRLSKVLDQEVPVVTLFEAPTVAALAVALRGELGDTTHDPTESRDDSTASAGQRRREKRLHGRRRRRHTEVLS